MKDTIKKLLDKEMSYSEDIRPLYQTNCAEVLMIAASEKYDLNLDERFVRAMFPFGQGMQTEGTCGCLVSALAILGIVCGENKPSTNADLKQLTQKFVKEFKEDVFGSENCLEIKKVHRTEKEGCTPVRLKTGELLDEFINEYRESHNK